MSIEEDFTNKDVKNIFYNFVIYELCEFVKHRGVTLKPIVYFSEDAESRGHTNDPQFEKAVVFIVNKLHKLMPIVIIKYSLTFNHFKRSIAKREPDSMSVLEKGIEKANTYDISKISFRKLRNFFKKHGLTFLDDTYFKQLQTKLLFIT